MSKHIAFFVMLEKSGQPEGSLIYQRGGIQDNKNNGDITTLHLGYWKLIFNFGQFNKILSYFNLTMADIKPGILKLKLSSLRIDYPNDGYYENVPNGEVRDGRLLGDSIVQYLERID